ncbi:LruC domain-containing protein [Pedobacter frigoris]|uniref:LruC domain-containing protein n=1 Tax=Pedobacter frigoris TaxID=2571272 RepID=UPI00292CB51D|nr:LruC domain-containing protein [Pedobacter frigoris]
MNKKLLAFYFFTCTLALVSCKKEIAGNDDNLEGIEKVAPDDFAYQTTKKVDLNVRLLTRTNQPVSGVLVSFYAPSAVSNGKEITKVMSDKDGYIRTKITIPSSLDTVVIDPAYVGLLRNAKAYIKNNSLSAIIGGEFGYSGNIIIQKTAISKKNSFFQSKLSSIGAKGDQSSGYIYDPNLYDELGRPKTLEPIDKIDFNELMKQVNAALPEREKVKDKYIATQVPTDLKIERLADVWITFVHEGADYRNSLGYYTYETGHAPKRPEDIQEVRMVFPNTSVVGGFGEGNMLQGDKIKIGRFTAGTSIGFVLLQNAYRGGGTIDYGANKFYSTEALNPESDARLRRHNVVLNNVSQQTFLIGFEDINRTPGQGSDQDFNDLVIYAQSNPVEAISPVDIPFLDENTEDKDGDGVPDFLDKFPDDKNRAYKRYYPSEEIWGTTAFEDNWPNEGDYDLNDLVVSYRYTFAMSSDNKLVDMTAEYKPLAAGADFQNGFGVQLPFDPSQISKVTGANISGSMFKFDANGLESKQNKAVIIPFDNYRNLFGANAAQVNTIPGHSQLDSKIVTIEISLNNPLSDDYTAMVPFNPFMISNMERGREIHLMNQPPTELANFSLFKTAADFSRVNAGKYYLTKDNRPFAIDFYGSFEYPIEKAPIYDVYLNFAEWAKSGGKKYANWYEDISGYRNTKLIYK